MPVFVNDAYVMLPQGRALGRQTHIARANQTLNSLHDVFCLQKEDMYRTIDLAGKQSIQIEEATELENEAGAVVWDAALCLIHYLARGASYY